LSLRVDRASILSMFCLTGPQLSCCNTTPYRQQIRRSLACSAKKLLLLSAMMTGLQACQLLGGARITELALGSGKPSNVATLVSVTNKGKPVVGLPTSAFEISENDQPINADTSQTQLLDVARYAAFHAVLLVDISQANQAPARSVLAKAAGAFVRRVRLGQPVTVVAFDGGDKVRVVADYPLDGHATAPEQVDALISMAPVDPSRDLRGAVAQSLEILDQRMSTHYSTVKLGTLTVFTRGPDLAGRYPREKMKETLSSNANKLVYIDVTGDAHDEMADKLSESGVIHAQTADTLPIAFEEAASLVDGLREQYYLISYCSPSRAGMRTLSVTVSVPIAEGKDEKDNFTAQFDATGFTAGCDPYKVAPLVLKSQSKKSKDSAPKDSATKDSALKDSATKDNALKDSASKDNAPSRPSTGKGGASNPTSKSGTKGGATQVDDDEAPVPSKPGYAQ
jgi:hypothetical protein